LPHWTDLCQSDEVRVSVREHGNPIATADDVYRKESIVTMEKEGEYWVVRAKVIAIGSEVRVIWSREERFRGRSSAESFANYLMRMLRLRFDRYQESQSDIGIETEQPVRLDGFSIFLTGERSITNHAILSPEGGDCDDQD